MASTPHRRDFDALFRRRSGGERLDLWGSICGPQSWYEAVNEDFDDEWRDKPAVEDDSS